MNLDQVASTAASWAATTGLKIAVALFLLLLSFRIITLTTRKLERRLIGGKRTLDKTLTSTAFYALRIVLKGLVVVCLVGYLGIDTGGITALIASLGVGVGLAVNGALSNLAGGALILVTRPFRIDDFIEAQGYSGTVEDIHMTMTRLRTPDNKIVYVPNGALSAGTIVNYSEKDIRRVDLTFSIGYRENSEHAKSVILQQVESHEKALKDPTPFIRISEHGDSRILIAVRVWVKSEDFWDVHFDLLESVKAAFDREGIEIPFPQLDVRVKQDA